MEREISHDFKALAAAAARADAARLQEQQRHAEAAAKIAAAERLERQIMEPA